MKNFKDLSPAIKQQVKTLADIIVKAVKAEKIILFGLYADENLMSQFADLPPVLRTFDVVVVVSTLGNYTDYEIQDKIEGNCRHFAPTTALVYDIDYVNNKIQDGTLFFYSLLQDGVLVYDTDRSLSTAPPLNLATTITRSKQDFLHWNSQASAFYAAALSVQHLHYNRITLFLLHQTVEQMYQAILTTHWGFKPTTHNIDKLRRYTVRLSRELAMIFPLGNRHEIHLFTILVGSYVGARYKSDFVVTDADLAELTNRVGRLISVGNIVCQNWIKKFEDSITSHA